MTKRLLVTITALCMLLACFPLAASAAAGDSVVIKLTIGSPTVNINGVDSKIQAPVKENGTTLVPLSVITRAFGAKLNLEKNKIITLKYNSTVVVLTIGSKDVKINGVVTKLTTAPKIVNSVTLVPVRVIAQAFGATVVPSGNLITITGKVAGVASANTGNTSTIDTDAGKTKVGDSYYGWSMNYPTDLSLSYQSDNGDWTVWSDGSDNPTVIIGIDDEEDTLTKEELRDHIQTYFDDNELVMEKKTISVAGVSYEKMVTKSRNGWFYEYRGTQKDNRVFVVMSGVKAASRDALNKYQDLLNSFTLSFNRADRSLKDVTKVVNGLITIHDEDYGLEVKLPVKWHRDPDSPTPLFYNVDEGFIDFAIKSVVNNETAEEWRAAERAKLEKEFASDYIRNFEESTITLMNGQGQVLKYEYSWNKTEWITEYDVFYIAGDHKYSINFYSLKDDASKGKGLFETIVNSLSIDTEYVDSNFSEMEEDADLAGQVVKKSSKKYGEDKDFETESVSYDSKYGFFTLDIMEETSASQYASRYASYLSTEDGKASGMQLKQTTSTMINGMAVTRMDITIEGTTRAYNSSMYLIEKNNRLFILEFFVQQANDTPAYQDEVTKVLQSLTFS
jgi:predicted nucleic acid-binding protein